MFRKSSIFMVFAIIFLTTFTLGSTASAEDQDEYHKEGLQIIEKSNKKIDHLIEKAVKKGDKLLSKYLLNLEKIEEENEAERAKLTAKFEMKRDKIIDKLYDVTLHITAKAIKDAEQYGVYSECEWVTVTIAGKEVEIDPVRVVGFGRRGGR
jgi:uncharacterized protein YicC (UPF0701 family)